MVVYATYVWLRRKRRGRLERQRQRACMVLLTIVSLIFLESGSHVAAVDPRLQLAGTDDGNAKATMAPLFRPADAAPP